MTRADPQSAALVGKRFIVTGASSGIGAAIATKLADAGAELVLLGRSKTRLLRSVPRRDAAAVRYVVVDFARGDSLSAALRRLRTDRRPFDGLIHSAGAYDHRKLMVSAPKVLARLMMVNVEAPVFLTLGLRDRLSPEAQVIFVNSSIVQRPAVDAAYYAATKHALRSLADSLRQEINSTGVRVTSLFPGRTATPMQRGITKKEKRRYDASALIQPADIAQLVSALVVLPRTIEITDVFMRPTSRAV
jgi:NADP-dependent 3-hydroxy acid dehydrogenase YdfG